MNSSNIQKSNHLLGSLDPESFGILEASFEPVSLELGQVLADSGEPFTHAYFHASGLTSLVMEPLHPVGVEVGVVGKDGMVGLPIVLGAGSSPHQAVVQIAGSGWRIPAPTLLAAFDANAAIRTSVLRYAHCFSVQIGSTACANAQLSVEERLARWLLMCQSRIESSEIRLTHEFLARMLSVRRPGVTVATHVLEGEGLIRATRGRITILDRDRLKLFAGRAYGIPEAEYLRLFPQPAEVGGR